MNARIELAYLDMGFDFHTKLLQMLDDRTINGTAKIGMLISNSSRFVADLIEYVLGNPQFLCSSYRRKTRT